MISTTIGKVKLEIVNSKCNMYIPQGMNGMQYAIWRKIMIRRYKTLSLIILKDMLNLYQYIKIVK